MITRLLFYGRASRSAKAKASSVTFLFRRIFRTPLFCFFCRSAISTSESWGSEPRAWSLSELMAKRSFADTTGRPFSQWSALAMVMALCSSCLSTLIGASLYPILSERIFYSIAYLTIYVKYTHIYIYNVDAILVGHKKPGRLRVRT